VHFSISFIVYLCSEQPGDITTPLISFIFAGSLLPGGIKGNNSANIHIYIDHSTVHRRRRYWRTTTSKQQAIDHSFMASEVEMVTGYKGHR